MTKKTKIIIVSVVALALVVWKAIDNYNTPLLVYIDGYSYCDFEDIMYMKSTSLIKNGKRLWVVETYEGDVRNFYPDQIEFISNWGVMIPFSDALEKLPDK